MRLNCNVEISPRSLLSQCSGPKQKASRASIVIGFPKGVTKDGDHLHLLICTAKNKEGTKYKVKANIEQLFEKFVSEGRATIRFRSPPHDVLLSQADLLQLKSFLKVLRRCSSEREEDCGKLSLTRLSAASTNQLQPPKTKVEIENRSAYARSLTFPSTLTILRIVDCGLKTVEQRILRLHQLQVLDLSHNDIEELPAEIGLLNLEDLNMAHNALKSLPAEVWVKNLARSLHLLDISHNSLNRIPGEICRLTSLKVLKVHDNRLSKLPLNLSNLQSLKHLSVANNCLSALPGGIAALRFESIDVSGNPFSISQYSDDAFTDTDCHTLLELAARSTLTNRLTVKEGDLPTHLMDYLSKWKRCVCGRFFVAPAMQFITTINLHAIAQTVTHSSDSSVPVSSVLCNFLCVDHVIRLK